jgi:2-polyprenyl-3-methyl-5-hydroxy-6-metoxy-1,4-benzoquinol methylase
MDLNKFKEFDFEGEQTLKAISAADKFNLWMYESINKYCSDKILEIGSGIGNISKFYVSNNYNIVLSDIRLQYRQFLNSAFPGHQVLNLDIVHPEFDIVNSQILGSFETIFALNVVEHIQDDQLAVNNMQKLLKPGGNLIILVPAFQCLFNEFDRQLYHYRRYKLSDLERLKPQNCKTIHSQYFNFMGIFGWFLVGTILKRKIIPESNMRLYNKLVPLFKFIDKIIMNKIGLSCIIVYTKEQSEC